MYYKQLATHVNTRFKEGASKEKIKDELISYGWSEDDIREAFYYDVHPEKLRSSFQFLQAKVPAYIMIISLGLLAIVFGITLFFFDTETVSYNINLPSVPEMARKALAYGEQPELSDPDFFGEVRQKFIDEKTSFIEADLSAMVVYVYKEGALSFEVPIQSKGREGSWWETPAGIYKISNKEKAHYSSMGHVWMPWSMNFQGNFFIHGRTYYPDGSLTSKEFTGGCIRLSTEDAQKVYDTIDIGTPVLVFERSFSPDSFKYKDEVGSSLSAPIYLSADLGNNHVFASRESTKVVPIASITKLMTALIATEYINLDNTATVPKEALIYTSRSRLVAGSRYTVYQLLFPLLMESSNEAAETIARYYGRSNFIQHMNEKSVSIGMINTNFADPSGASADNTSTTEDLFMLAKYIYFNRSFIFNITSGKVKNSAYGDNGWSDLGNYNDFIDNEYFFGGKNGQTTAASETNLSVFDIPVFDTKRPIVLIILGSTSEKKNSQELLDYTLNHFRQD